MQDRETLMRAAALCRGVRGKLNSQAEEAKFKTTRREFGLMAKGAGHCVLAIEKAISLLPESSEPSAGAER